MVFRRGLALLCVAAAVALTDVNSGVDAAVHKRAHHHAKETEINYPNGAVHISTQDDGKSPETHHKQEHHHHHRAKKEVDDDSDDSSDDRKAKKQQLKHETKAAKKKKAAADANVEEKTIKYEHGSVRISTPKSADTKDAHVHKTTSVQKVHATTHGHHHHHKHKQGDVVKDVELQEGVNEFKIAGVPLKITVDNGKVDVNVAGKHVKSGAEVTVDTDEKPAKKHHHKDKKDKAAHKKAEAPKKAEETTVSATADSAKVADAKANRVTELATKLAAKEDRGFFASQTAPVVFICGIIGALAAVVGIAAVAVARAREHAVEDVNLHSVLADASEADLEAAATQDAPSDHTDSLDDSESDNDDDDDREGTFANNERAPTVSV